MNLSRSILKLFLSNASTSILSFLGIVYFSNNLTPSQLGTFFLFQSLTAISTMFTDFGISGALEKRLSEGIKRGELIASSVALKAGLLVPAILIVVLFKGQLNAYVGADVAEIFVAAVILQEAVRIPLQVLKGDLRVGRTALIIFIQKATWVTAGVILVMTGFETLAPILALVIGYGVESIVAIWRANLAFALPSWSACRSLVDYSRFEFVSSLGGFLYNWLDVVIIGIIISQEAVGTYEVAWQITLVVMVLSRAISTTIFPQISKFHSSESVNEIRTLIGRSIASSLFLTIPAFFGTLLLSKEILRFIFGPEYVGAAVPLIILMADKVGESVQVVIGRSLQAIDRPDLAARATVVGVVLNLVLNVVLIYQFGIVGAAIGTFGASLVADLLHLYYFDRLIPISFPYRRVAIVIAASVAMTGVLVAITMVVPVDSVDSFVFVVGLGVIVYCTAMAVSTDVRGDVRAVIANL